MGVMVRNGRYVLRWKDGTGQRRFVTSNASTKTEAKRLLRELQQQAERQRLGLEALPPEDGGGSLTALLNWWLTSCSTSSPSHARNESVIRTHLLSSELAPLPLTAITSAKVEAFLHRKEQEGLSPQSLNHLRGFLSRAFNTARRLGRYKGQNPISDVQKRRIPKRPPSYLKADEVARLLQALAPRWQPMFATAIYTGLRKSELIGLRKIDVDLDARLLTVSRSRDRDTTKGGHADTIPIAAELVPYLERAIAASPSELVFPRHDGSMMREDVDLVSVLRRAMARAGIVTGWRHLCRRKGCGHVEKASDGSLRRCPVDGRKLWPKPEVRAVRFHDTRHTTASLLMMSGANPAAVQRIMRHADPKLTMDVYSHLAPDYLRAEVDRLAFGVRPSEVTMELPLLMAANTKPTENGAPVVQFIRNDQRSEPITNNSSEIQTVSEARQAGLEPTTLGLEGRCSIRLSYWRER